ncbi:SufE family protein [Sediminispirochaeta smaragdinae]|uniref:Fe-S metabolism associated SufE n=1 Tax=Sediminispirochaeta smaragdinae (strain DSM 11293 / JCM 15392 / SEBR 4228) TaxID=573413 RepID=E1R4T6_SEDSS|nr:SufE family protein [Sediminispirochaeta smaragdinae]ADK82174.1 Fe-S metabolism associated SufE [Sediminispirochaeta smaragdinae DSM 11293]
MTEEMSISQLEDTFIEDINNLGDWFLQYEYLIEISVDIPHIELQERTHERKVPGCQSGVWIILKYVDKKVRIRADSEALIIRGFLAMYVLLLDNRTPEEILSFHPRFIEETNIKSQISTDRFHGLQSVFSTIQDFAAKCIETE